MTRRIFDCFTFFNELEVLELRLHELSPVVDKFVLVEATRTHSNQPKPLYFAENKERFGRFLPKIEHIVVDDFPAAPPDRWVLENFQRDAILRGLTDARPEDVVIVSDVDEIFRPQALLDYKDRPGIKLFKQSMYYYFFNCQLLDLEWYGSKMAFFRDLKSPQWLRMYPGSGLSKNGRRIAKRWSRLKRLVGQEFVIPDGGWHFSYLGGIERIKYKIRSFAHSEHDTDDVTSDENLLRAIETGTDLFGRSKEANMKFVPIDGSFPRYLIENREKYASMIRPV